MEALKLFSMMYPHRHIYTDGGRLHIIDDVGVAAAEPKIGGLC